MILLILKFTLAHILGDFVLQPNAWVQDKESKKYKSVYLYLHIIIHLIVLWILLGFDFSFWFALVIIPTSHFIIDLTKTYTPSTLLSSQKKFVLDQCLHGIVIALVVHHYIPYEIETTVLYAPKTLAFVTFLILTTFVSSIIMKVIISRWDLTEDTDENSLDKAGTYIGVLERLFIFAFIISNHWEGVGFLLASKSVFRFGDLSKTKDRKLTEYILIGTLLSFGLAIFFSIVYLEVVKQIS